MSFGQQTNLDTLARPTQTFVTVPAPAKINLYLHVTGKRADGYHELDSLIVFTALHDVITVAPHGSLTFHQRGPFGNSLIDEPNNNLVLRAAHMLANLAGIPAKARIGLYKTLPIAAGLGGGSADAAAALHALCQLWLINPSEEEMDALALSLGADVPVCLKGLAAHVSGIGDLLNPLQLCPSPIAMVLINPNIPLSTKLVYGKLRGPYTPPQPLNILPNNIYELAYTLGQRTNDLATPARELCPIIDEVLEALTASEGCQLARLSGSGPSCFGLFTDTNKAETAASRISALKGDWWVKPTHSVSNITTLS